jgi:hypothetical protein
MTNNEHGGQDLTIHQLQEGFKGEWLPLEEKEILLLQKDCIIRLIAGYGVTKSRCWRKYSAFE